MALDSHSIGLHHLDPDLRDRIRQTPLVSLEGFRHLRRDVEQTQRQRWSDRGWNGVESAGRPRLDRNAGPAEVAAAYRVGQLVATGRLGGHVAPLEWGIEMLPSVCLLERLRLKRVAPRSA